MSAPSAREGGAPSPDVAGGPSSPSVALDAELRLLAEVGERVDLTTVRRVLLVCVRDLAGCPAAALPELLERLAREDLLDLARCRAPRDRRR